MSDLSFCYVSYHLDRNTVKQHPMTTPKRPCRRRDSCQMDCPPPYPPRGRRRRRSHSSARRVGAVACPCPQARRGVVVLAGKALVGVLAEGVAVL